MEKNTGDFFFPAESADITDHRKTYDEILASEEKYRAFFATSIDCVFITTLDGKWVDFNEAAIDLFGYESREELMDVKISDLYADPADRKDHIRNIIEKGYSFEYPVNLRKKDGTIISTLITSVARKDGEGNIIGFQGTIRDITETKAAQDRISEQYEDLARSRKAIHESEAEYKNILRTAMDGFCIVGPAGSLLDVNDAFCTMTGYSRDELLARSLADIEVKETETDIAGHIQEIIRKGADRFESQYRCRDGSIIDVEVSVVHSETPSRHFVVFVHDITNRKRAEEILKSSDARMRAMLESIIAGVVIIDPDTHTIVDANTVAARMIGAEKEAIIGSVCHKYICPAEAGSCPITDLNQIVDHSEKLLIHADGTTSPILKSVVPVRLSDRTYLLESFIDISDIKKAENALRESEEKFRDIFDKANDAIEIIEMRDDLSPGKYIDVNEVASRMLGYTKEEMLQHGPLDFDITDYSPRQYEEIAKKLQSAGHVTFETGHRRKDGGIIPVEVNYHIITLLGKKVGLSIVRDTTGRKQVETALKESEEKYRMLADLSSDMITIFDLDGVITYASPAVKSILGYTPEEIIGKNAFDFSTGVNKAEQLQMFREFKAGKRDMNKVQVHLPKKDGTFVIVENIISPIFKEGTLAGLLLVGRDITERMRAEDALRESEERYRTLFISSRDAMMTIEPPDWRFTSANPATVAMFRAKDEADLLSRWPWELSPEYQPDGRLSAEKAKENIEKAVNEGSNFFEWTHRRLNGEDFPATVLATRFKWKGQIIIQGTVRDITGQKRAEVALRESEEKFRGVAERSSDLIILTDSTGRATYTSPSVNRILGFTPEEITGKKPFDFIHPDDIEAVHEGIRKNLEGTATENIEVRIRKKDGGFAILDITGSPVMKNEQAVGLQIIGRDITDRKRMEVSLHESEQKFRDLFENSRDGITIADAATRKFVESNETFLRMFGYNSEEVENLGIQDIHPEDSLPEVFAALEKMLKKGSILSEDLPVKRKDGTVFYADVSAYPITIAGKVFLVGVFRDISGRRQAEAALAESEEKFRGVAERSSDIIQLTDTTGRITYVSPSIKRILGFEPEEIVGTAPDAIVHPEDLGAVHELIRKNMAGSPDVEAMVTRVRKKGGGYATLEVIVSPVIKDGVLSGMQVMARDITEKKAAQARIDELLRLQEEQVEIINTSPAVAFLWKAEENWPVETVSKNISRFGYTPDDLISGRVPFSSIIHPDDLGRVSAEVEYNSTHNIDTFYQVYRIFGKDKKEYWIEDFTRIRRDSSGGVTHYQGIILDITDRKRAEMERDRLVSVIRHTSELVGLSTPDRKIMFLNEAGAKMLGTTPAESLGHDFSEFVPDHLKENLQSVLLPALIEHGHWEGDLQYRNVKTGNLLDVHAMTFLIGDPVTGAPQFLATVSLDITDRKLAEAQLKKYSGKLEEMVAERTKKLEEAQEQLVKKEKLAVLGKLAGGVGHELRNPLGAIKNAAYFLNMVLENPEPDVKETLEIMTKEVARSEDILSSLLDFARPTVLMLRKVRINDVIAEAVARNPIAENITLTRNLDDTLPDIMADPDKLLQVFTNLVTNACQAMPAGGSLTLQSALLDRDQVMVSVTDTGVGISEEHMKRLFEPLFSTKAKGIGLGLVVTKLIVDAHHGSIDIRSEEGKGTTFTVTLPIGIEGGPVT